MSLLMRNCHRRAPATAAASCRASTGSPAARKAGSRSTGSTTSTASRRRKGAAETNVHPGDHIWWDRHDWSQTEDVPAVVGSFPEPFLNGIDGKRLPVRVECAIGRQRTPCRTVTARLRALGVPAASPRSAAARSRTRCACWSAPWPALERDPDARSDRAGPARERRVRALRRRRADAHAARPERRAPVRTLERRRGPDRGDALRRRTRRCGSSPAPTPPASNSPRARFDAPTLDDRFAVALSRAAARDRAAASTGA